ncbi:flagellar hook-length control protein FliK [Herbaspirillum sp. HC18]|nr:flagellar hook-length control protein FliK [Herbaspirillum sp. HC18]
MTAAVMTIMPAVLNLPALTAAVMPQNANASAQAATSAAAIDGVQAVEGMKLAAVQSRTRTDTQQSAAGAQPDIDPALKAQMPQSAVSATASAVVTPLDQGNKRMPDTAVNTNAQPQRSVSLAAATKGNAPESEAVKSVSQRSNTGVTAEFSPQVSLAIGANASASQPETIKLAGAPSQWQQPLREALGERLQVQLGRNSEHAVIRLDPPMLGRIEISIRHEAGALQVHMSASNNEVVRQLQGIGESLRQDLIHRQYNDVAVVVSSASSRNLDADASGRQRQGDTGREDKGPGRALNEADQGASAFAFLKDSE